MSQSDPHQEMEYAVGQLINLLMDYDSRRHPDDAITAAIQPVVRLPRVINALKQQEAAQ